MASFNKVILIGNVTADPELKQTQNGTSICSFSIAVNRKFKTENGQQNVDFINIVTWRQQAEFVTRYFRKGNPILVCGQLQTREWTDKQGTKRIAVEVVADELAFVSPTGTAQSPAPSQVPPNPATLGGKKFTPAAYTQSQMNFNAPNFEEIPSDQDLPF